MNKNAVQKEAQELLKQGTSKQDAFELLVDKYMNPESIAEILKNIPSPIAIAKYGIWNNVLLSLLILLILMFIFFAQSIGLIFCYGLLAYGVAMKRGKYYNWVSIISFIGLIVLLGIIFLSKAPIIHWEKGIPMLILVVANCILSIWLAKKLCPKPRVRYEVDTNTSEQNRTKKIYEFIEE